LQRAGGNEGAGNGHGHLPRRAVRDASTDAIGRSHSSAEAGVTFLAL
jgi:hypothetical protein